VEAQVKTQLQEQQDRIQYFQQLLLQVEVEVVEMMAALNQIMLVGQAEVGQDTKLNLFVELLEIHLQYHLLKVCLVEMDQAEQELIILAEAAVELSILDAMALILLHLVIQEKVEMEHQMILQVQLLIMLVAVEVLLQAQARILMEDKVAEAVHLEAQNVEQLILVVEDWV
jgi:hypothetical protein